jgi:hypothetical protein
LLPGQKNLKILSLLNTMSDILEKSVKSGLSGAGAMTVQVTTLMWLRTIMNYQYRHGGTIKGTITTLYKDGGIPRFYKGVGAALFQGPLSRFGDTFSNTLALSVFSYNQLSGIPVFVQTGFASVTAGLFRIGLMPIDTVKTSMQVEGSIAGLKTRLKTNGPKVLFNGAIATSSATMVGHYPWFATYNYLNAYLPKYDDPLKNMARNAFIGFNASIISDTLSNSLRIVKTTKQSHPNPAITYKQIADEIIKKDGMQGLLGRGLKIRLMTNGIQGIMFSVVWKYLSSL